MDITVQVRNVYGEDKVYPICSNAKLFAEIAGTKTLTRDALQRIKWLGVEIKDAPSTEFFDEFLRD
jgi:hypothetical protein|tara:strand:+ start:731 stop:928 length:198 start_codon:yes stop_codon:yes gene_type:complete